MQEQLGCPVGETYEGDLIYKFADGWGITSRCEILRFAKYNQSWQTPNRAVVLSQVLDINDETLISDILNNIIDLRALVVDNFFIDLLEHTIDDDGFEIDETWESNEYYDVEILLYRGWVVNLDTLEIIEQGEQSKEIERKLNALIKALDYRDLGAESFVEQSYFANTEQDENYIDLWEQKMIISICNEKGGSGKSTLSINIATYLATQAKKPLWLIDSDPQKSISVFLSIRDDEKLEKVFNYTYKNGDDLKEFLTKHKQEKEILLIDTGGRDSKDARIAIALSDLVLIPTTASQLDISVLDLMIERLREAKKVNSSLKALIVMNRVATNPFLTSKKDTLIEYIKDLIKDDLDYIKLANTIIYEREAFKVAIQMGRGVFELNKNSKASGEIQNLCKEISKTKGT